MIGKKVLEIVTISNQSYWYNVIDKLRFIQENQLLGKLAHFPSWIAMVLRGSIPNKQVFQFSLQIVVFHHFIRL